MRNPPMKLISGLIFCCMTAIPVGVSAQTAKPAWQTDWDKVVEAAKKEGKVVVSLPASNELRAAIERLFENRYGIDVEPIVGRASTVVRKMVDEAKAGVRYTDLHMGGSESVVTGMLPEGIVDPLEPYMMLPEVKDPKQWWGGHIWVDNAKKFAYSHPGLSAGEPVVQFPTDESRRCAQLRRSARREIQRQDRLSRSAHSRFGRVVVVLSSRGERRGIPAQAGWAEAVA